ncbi:MAG: hypothetical protein RSB02_05660, partial [Anaerovoracaceae bacterium]
FFSLYDNIFFRTDKSFRFSSGWHGSCKIQPYQFANPSDFPPVGMAFAANVFARKGWHGFCGQRLRPQRLAWLLWPTSSPAKVGTSFANPTSPFAYANLSTWHGFCAVTPT